ncbi:Similar to far1: Fatty acyl-CoA reductase 1 (Xenopus laevis) [Cotesia congregata]|uniref:Fatty acyl-CoA reductase n=1 Tax=Cotesia congregata TaxID=51543 RepID=A0A8J2MB41_COTCN|nr:Similar to far1: Fatty acyl-CoA reductase 1 (Xenopus laevis) [Cotesia congregata]
MDQTKSIPKFYDGRSVLITGATGFMGKVLVEKLLRSCPDVREIFVLMRPKKGLSIDNRVRQLLTLPLFDRLKKENPSVLDKVIPIEGDTIKEGLGIPDFERKVLIERVSVVFHVAASVRFDDPLKTAVFTNTRSTRDMCILAAQMKKLVIFMHVSTTYNQADKPVVEEKLYPCEVDWKKTIKIVETINEELLKTFTPKYLGSFPNTYTFTKRMAEQVVSDYSHVIPAVVFRPSIVIATMDEPMPGWVDNFNGPTGLMVGGGKGVLRTVYGDPQLRADFIPVDVAIKAMIIASWKRGIRTITKDPSVHVYNCSSADMKNVSVEEIKRMALICASKNPLEGIIWAPSITYTTNNLYYFASVLLFHLLPGLVLDFILYLSGHKPMLVKLQRRVYIANTALSYFLTHEWEFKNANLFGLLSEVSEADSKNFLFDFASIDVSYYFENCLIGAKKYLLNEKPTDSSVAKRHLTRMIWIDKIFKGLLLLFFIWILYAFDFYSYVMNSVFI